MNIRDLVRPVLSRSPRLKRAVRRIYSLVHGNPQITYAELTFDEIRRLVGRPNPTILELGCNDGGHTRHFLDAFEQPTIYCFEPDPRAATRFRRQIGDRPNVHLFEGAVSDRDGEITFHQSSGHRSEKDVEDFPDGWDLSGSIHRPTGHLGSEPLVTFTKILTVPTTSLDSWCARHQTDAVDFLWMDVQGAEGDVFRGGSNTLGKTRILYTEGSDTEQYEGQLTTKQLLAQLPDFEVLTRYPSDILLRNRRLK